MDRTFWSIDELICYFLDRTRKEKIITNRTKKIEKIEPALEEQRQPSVGQNKYKSYIQQTTNNKQQTTLLLLFQKSLYIFHHLYQPYQSTRSHSTGMT